MYGKLGVAYVVPIFFVNKCYNQLVTNSNSSDNVAFSFTIKCYCGLLLFFNKLSKLMKTVGA